MDSNSIAAWLTKIFLNKWQLATEWRHRYSCLNIRHRNNLLKIVLGGGGQHVSVRNKGQWSNHNRLLRNTRQTLAGAQVPYIGSKINRLHNLRFIIWKNSNWFDIRRWGLVWFLFSFFLLTQLLLCFSAFLLSCELIIKQASLIFRIE